MLKQSRFLLMGGLVLGIAFVVCVVHLLQLRFQAGDVYPPYSSLRADPLGARAFFESLQSLPSLHVERFYEDTDKLADGHDTTLFALGFVPDGHLESDETEARQLEQFMNKGGRIVFTFQPIQEKPFWARLEEQMESKRKSEGKEETESRSKKAGDRSARRLKLKRSASKEDAQHRPVDLCERWNVSLGYQARVGGLAERQTNNAALPEKVTQHSVTHFQKPGEGWRVLFTAGGHPVLIERSFGAGTLVLAADSFLLSNEALRADRQTGLLTWLVGASHRVYFDETHLGVAEHPGLATLIRKYQLHALVAAFLLLAGLFIWRNTLSFVPPYEEDAAMLSHEVVAGRDSAAGFVNLLRRNLGSRELLRTCFEEWKRSCLRQRSDLRSRADRMEAVLREQENRPASLQTPAAVYAEMSRILNERS